MSNYDLVKGHYVLPFDLYGFQKDAVEEHAPEPRSALYFEPGLGKTATSTVCALFHKLMGTDTVIVLMPPIILTTWKRWLSSIKKKDGSDLDVLVYQGSPAERLKMTLTGHDFVLMSMQIFKKDYERITDEFGHKKVHVILDEAQCIKDVSTQNYKKFRDFADTQSFQLLTGTPLNNPLDAYAYIKLAAPHVYRNLAQFERIHIYERDFFGNAVAYQNLELLQSNLLLSASRKTKEEVLLDLPELIITPIEYELDPAHYRLYKTLVEEQLLRLPDGDKLDVTQATALYHALGQVIMQWRHFSQDDSVKAAGYNLIEEVLDELGGKKLIVFANYVRTNREIVERFGCPGVWGEVSAKEKQKALDKFIEDPECRLITLQPVSGGVGINLQHVCCDILYVEPPIAVSHWIQSLSRCHRDGQKLPVTVRMAQALGTIQVRLIQSLTNKEELVNPLQQSRALLKEALLGR